MISHPKVSLNLTAHLSSKACAKVWLAAKEMAEVLCFELLPRLDVWPKSFKSSKLIDDNIAIYFFSVKGRCGNQPRLYLCFTCCTTSNLGMILCFRDDQVFDNLLYNLRHYDFALKALVGDSELLIFTSAQLPEKHQSNCYHPKVLNAYKLLYMFQLTTLNLQDLRVNYIYGAFSMEDKLLLNTHPMIVSFIIPE